MYPLKPITLKDISGIDQSPETELYIKFNKRGRTTIDNIILSWKECFLLMYA